MYLIIVCLPLISALNVGFLGRYIGLKGANLISCTSIIICLFFSLTAFYEIGLAGSTYSLIVCKWISSGFLKLSWGFLFDSLSVAMLVIVTFISSLVHLYSIGYMDKDPHNPRFMSYLSIFTFFMIFLVTSNNMMQMFLGWEGVGLASYLLINFWFTRLAANQSAVKALIVNRIGDASLIISIISTFYLFKSVDYSIIFSLVPLFQNTNVIFLNNSVSMLTIIGFFLSLAAFGKSAQLGLHTWLPDAMEGPTPVSALLHAATMVTAGVFLLIRFSPVLEYTPIVLFLLTIFGSMTAFFASLVGTFQNDIKKVIAYSTCSQLGYMIFICGISSYQVSIFHLVNHAFFKALLFLSAGSIIHALNDEQDIRRMGSLRHMLPLSYIAMFVGSLALIGFPFLTGFYSKDLILELSQIYCYKNLNKNFVNYSSWLIFISVIFTSFYTFRLLYIVFLNNTNITKKITTNVHDSTMYMAIPLVLLSLLSIFIGFLGRDMLVGIGTTFWNSSIFILPNNYFLFESEELLPQKKNLPFFMSFIGFFFSTLLNKFFHVFFKLFKYNQTLIIFVLSFLSKKWYIDNLYNNFLVIPIIKIGYFFTFKNLDKGYLEFLGPFGISYLIEKTSRNLVLSQSGQITHYVFFIVIGMLLIFCIQFYLLSSFLDGTLLLIYFIYLIFINYIKIV